MTVVPESRTPELQEVLRTAIEYYVRDISVSLPGRIEAYDSETQKADVKPLVKRLVAAGDGSEILETLPVITGVPVKFERGGGFFHSFPVQPGDFCLLVFNSFPIDKYLSGDGSDLSPEDFSTHNMSDAVALMGFAPFSRSIREADPDKMIMGKEGGMQISVDNQGSLVMAALNAATQAVALAAKVEAGLQNIVTALNTSVTGAMDGGALYKSNIGLQLNDPVTSVGSSKVSAEE